MRCHNYMTGQAVPGEADAASLQLEDVSEAELDMEPSDQPTEVHSQLALHSISTEASGDDDVASS